MGLLDWLHSASGSAPGSLERGWLLVPLGNPGEDYAATRHNLGRLMLQRWMDHQGLRPERVLALGRGGVYAMAPGLGALVPSTYMNHSGEACREAERAGFNPQRMILLQDDKDLPLGVGRFRLSGSDGGHNGLKSVFECLGTQDVARLRLGIGPIQRPLHDFVLGLWCEGEWEQIEAMDGSFGRFMELLGHVQELAALPGLINGERFWREGMPREKGIEPQAFS